MTTRLRAPLVACCTAVLTACFTIPAAADGVAGQPAVDALVQRLGLEEGATPVRELPGWRKPRKVLVWNAQPARVAELQAAAPGVELLLAKDATEAVAARQGC